MKVIKFDVSYGFKGGRTAYDEVEIEISDALHNYLCENHLNAFDDDFSKYSFRRDIPEEIKEEIDDICFQIRRKCIENDMEENGEWHNEIDTPEAYESMCCETLDEQYIRQAAEANYFEAEYYKALTVNISFTFPEEWK